MFLKTIVDQTEETGSVLLILAADEGSGEETLTLSTGEWKRMTKALPLCETDEITEERYDALHAAAERTAALREGARILGSGDSSISALRRKLRFRGFSEEAAEYAAAFLQKKGYLDEEAACSRYAEAALHTRHYGRRRILDYLLAHGYGHSAADAAVKSLPDEEIRQALLWQLERKFPDPAALDPAGIRKAAASLMRLGFSADEIFSELKKRR